MNFSTLSPEGLLLIDSFIIKDDRGYFFESYHKKKFEEHGFNWNFVQDNESRSSTGVLRGLHYQNPPYEQGKLVRVVKGKALDVVVDIRKSSKTFGKHYKVILDDVTKKMLWIPPGFAHGFVSLEDDTIFVYKCTGFYNKLSERGIKWNDPALGIDWETADPLISAKDDELPFLKDIELVF